MKVACEKFAKCGEKRVDLARMWTKNGISGWKYNGGNGISGLKMIKKDGISGFLFAYSIFFSCLCSRKNGSALLNNRPTYEI